MRCRLQFMPDSTHRTCDFAKQMRRIPTDAERKLCGCLRNSSLGGFKFYRQVPIGSDVVDFLCHRRGLVIEVDGATHSTDDEVCRDERRARYLNSFGLYLHRVNNTEVYRNIGSILDGINAVLMERGDCPASLQRWRFK
jgi:very-short-patch-repair endonuclease